MKTWWLGLLAYLLGYPIYLARGIKRKRRGEVEGSPCFHQGDSRKELLLVNDIPTLYSCTYWHPEQQRSVLGCNWFGRQITQPGQWRYVSSSCLSLYSLTWRIPGSEKYISLLVSYFGRFSDKLCCYQDMKDLLGTVAKKEPQDQEKFLQDLQATIPPYNVGQAKEDNTVSKPALLSCIFKFLIPI